MVEKTELVVKHVTLNLDRKADRQLISSSMAL
jgi:hypothetical protein